MATQLHLDGGGAPAPSHHLLGPTCGLVLVREAPAELPPPLDSPSKAAKALGEIIPDDGRERFGCVYLDVRHRPLGVYVVSVGCLTASLVHPREVFAPALQVGTCACVILWHNHPSGDPEPSAEDTALTRRLGGAGTMLGVEVVDHLVLGSGSDRFVSLKERGIL